MPLSLCVFLKENKKLFALLQDAFNPEMASASPNPLLNAAV